MALILRFAARSDVGKVRSKNDDSAYAGNYLAVVADGMGGHVGGDVASASTVLDLVHLDRHVEGNAETVLPDEIQTANSILNEGDRTMPEVYVHAIEGQTKDQKRALIKDITDAVVKNFGVTADAVLVEILESSRDNKAKGGVLFSER